jgi:hypothetical protein
VTPVHPFLNLSKADELIAVVTRFHDTKSILVKQKYSHGRAAEEVIEHVMHRPPSTEIALEILRKIEPFQKLTQLKEEKEDENTFRASDVSGVDLELLKLNESIFDTYLARKEGGYVTNEEKILHVLKNKWDEATDVLVQELVLQYIDHSGSSSSSKLVFLEYCDTLKHASTTSLESFKALFNSIVTHYPGLAQDVDVLNAALVISAKYKDVDGQLKIIKHLKDLGYAPSTSSLNQFLEQFATVRGSKGLNMRSKLEQLVGLSNTVFTCLDGDTVKFLIPWCISMLELNSLLRSVDEKFTSDAERGAEYAKFADVFVERLLTQFPTSRKDTRFELIQKLKRHTTLSLATQTRILEDVVAKGSLILACTLVKTHRGPVDVAHLAELVRSRSILKADGKPGFDIVSREHFLQTLGEINP